MIWLLAVVALCGLTLCLIPVEPRPTARRSQPEVLPVPVGDEARAGRWSALDDHQLRRYLDESGR